MEVASMRVVAISDTHGKHWDLELPEGDVLIHAGDFTSRGEKDEVADFNKYLGTLPFAHIIVIAGNHDFFFERSPGLARDMMTHCVYLQDEAVTIDHVNFYGSPWQPTFFNWAFNLPRGAPLREKWELIPKDTHVLITHGPPHGIRDVVAKGRHVGCKELLAVVKEVQPLCHIFGHIHEDAGVFQTQETCFINASSLDLAYDLVNAPIVFDID